MKAHKLICNCCNVTVGKIAKVMQEGARSVEEVQAKTKAGTCCGKCRDHLRGVVEALLEEQFEK